MVLNLILFGLLYGMCAVATWALIEMHNGYTDIHEIVWWPITLVKFLLKTLWKVLFTGWTD